MINNFTFFNLLFTIINSFGILWSKLMIKKSLLILISLFILLSCSNKVIAPLESEEVLIEKYGIDINKSERY